MKFSKLLQNHFFTNFNSLSCESDNLRLKCYIELFYIDIILEQNKTVEHTVAKSYDICYS